MIDDQDISYRDFNPGERIKMSDKKEEAVDHPAHYCYGKYEVIDIIEGLNLNYHLGNAFKYLSRCNYKGKKTEDLKKCIWYLEREIKREEKKAKDENNS